MKVIQINTVYKYSSPGIIADEIHNRLISKNIESLIIYGTRKINTNQNIKYIGSRIEFLWHALVTRLFDLHGRASTFQTQRIIKYIKKEKPDIIHLHNIHGYYLNYKKIFKFIKKSNLPIVWTFHDCWPFTGHCAYYTAAGCQKWKDGCYKCPSKKDYPASYLFDNSKSNFKLKRKTFSNIENLTIVTPSKWLKDEVKNTYFKDNPIEVINNGIDLELWTNKGKTSALNRGVGKEFMILGVSNIWEPRKGLTYFIELSDKLKSDEFIVLVGKMSKEEKQNLPENIVHIERTSNREELAELYREANVFLNPTLEDNFPTVNIESLACGTPVITFETGGSPEIIDEKTGIVVNEKSAEALRKAIEYFRNNMDKFSRENCRQRALKLYDKNQRFDDYIELYKEIIAKE